MNPEIRDMVAGQMGGAAPEQEASAANIPPQIQQIYDQYAQQAQQAGQPVMPIEQFMEQVMAQASQMGQGAPAPGGPAQTPPGSAPPQY